MKRALLAAAALWAMAFPAGAQVPPPSSGSAPWFVAEAGACREVQTPSERVQALRRAGERAARAIPFQPPGSAEGSEPTRFTIERSDGTSEVFFRERANCQASAAHGGERQASDRTREDQRRDAAERRWAQQNAARYAQWRIVWFDGGRVPCIPVGDVLVGATDPESALSVIRLRDADAYLDRVTMADQWERIIRTQGSNLRMVRTEQHCRAWFSLTGRR